MIEKLESDLKLDPYLDPGSSRLGDVAEAGEPQEKAEAGGSLPRRAEAEPGTQAVEARPAAADAGEQKRAGGEGDQQEQGAAAENRTQLETQQQAGKQGAAGEEVQVEVGELQQGEEPAAKGEQIQGVGQELALMLGVAQEQTSQAPGLGYPGKYY